MGIKQGEGDGAAGKISLSARGQHVHGGVPFRCAEVRQDTAGCEVEMTRE